MRPRSMAFRDQTFSLPQDTPPARLDRVLRGLLGNPSWNAVRQLVSSGKIAVQGRVVVDPATPVRGGDEIALTMNARRPGSAPNLDRSRLIHVDAQVVVVDKPAGVSTVPFDDTERDTLIERVQRALKQSRGGGTLGVVQRLDKQTSGLIVFPRTLVARRHLAQQFRVHSVTRRYLALAHGRVDKSTFRSRLVKDRGDGLRGSTDNPLLGREAITHVEPRETLSATTLIGCRLETGRTHQIRIHLSEAGHPLLGENVYTRGFAGPLLPAPRLMLHAAELGFVHPSTGRTLHFELPLPEDMQRTLQRLRRGAG
jgi:23S rRNA pseudouridine1911/1915/1917 synthase